MIPVWGQSGGSNAGGGSKPLVLMDFVNQAYYLSGNGYALASVPGWSFTRASVGTAQDSAGNVVSFASGAPRTTDLGMLVEESRTNLATQSQDIGNAAWSKTDITVGAATTAPDGSSTAKLATAGSAGTDSLVTSTATITASQSVVMSLFLKKSGSQWLRLVFGDTTGTDGFNQWVDLTNGVLGTSSVRGAGTKTSAVMEPYVNGWYRVTLVGVASTRTAVNLTIVSASADGSSTRVNGATYYPWQIDINAGVTFQTSPIATTGSSATRAADLAAVTGITVPALSSLFLDALVPVGVSTDARVFLNDGGSANRVGFIYDGITSVSPQVQIASVTQNNNSGIAIVGTRIKVATGYDGVNWHQAVNGVATSSQAGSTPAASLNQLSLFNNGGSQIRFWNNYIKQVEVLNGAASDVRLAALTQ